MFGKLVVVAERVVGAVGEIARWEGDLSGRNDRLGGKAGFILSGVWEYGLP